VGKVLIWVGLDCVIPSVRFLRLLGLVEAFVLREIIKAPRSF
jgi:hypothetical protein